MSVCAHCRVYPGTPTCVSCRTHFRIGALLQSGRLPGYCEERIISALRYCAGAISDLVEGEVSGPFGPGGGNLAGTRSPEKGAWPLTEAEEEGAKDHIRKERRERPQRKSEKKPRVDRQEKKTRRRRRKDRPRKNRVGS